MRSVKTELVQGKKDDNGKYRLLEKQESLSRTVLFGVR